MDQVESFAFLKNCLVKLNYPNINSLDDLDVADIFSKANRQFLVGWFLKQLDGSFGEILENSTSEDLAEIISCYGFCSNLEKNRFMNGESDSHTQFIILNRMFQHLESHSSPHLIPNEENKDFSNEDIGNLMNFDNNLFPNYGHKKTNKQISWRLKKIGEYQNEIEELKNRGDSTGNEDQTRSENIKDLPAMVETELHRFERNLPEFKRKFLDILRAREGLGGRKVEFNDNFAQDLKTCCANAANVLHFLKNMDVITNAKKRNSLAGMKDLGGNLNVTMRQVSELCNEVHAFSIKLY